MKKVAITCLVLLLIGCGKKENNMADSTNSYTLAEAQEKLAKKYFNHVWDLMEKPDRTPADDEAMVHAVHASCFLWMQVGTPLHQQRGEWQVARVYSLLNHGESALRHARRCMELTEKHPDLMTDFDLAFANECLARAHAISGNKTEAEKFIALAEKAGELIKDKDDRKVFFDDFNGGPWGGLK